MQYAPEDYTRHYIVTALFKLMNEYQFEKISVKDIAEKAGVGRATFYRYFKSKEEVIAYYFEHNTREFVFSQRIYPRCREDHTDLYLDFLNKKFAETFERDYTDKSEYLPYLYAGMLYNVSMKWLEEDCSGDPAALAALIVDVIFNAK